MEATHYFFIFWKLHLIMVSFLDYGLQPKDSCVLGLHLQMQVITHDPHVLCLLLIDFTLNLISDGMSY